VVAAAERVAVEVYSKPRIPRAFASLGTHHPSGLRGKGSNLKSHGSGGARRNDTVAMVTAEADGPATRPETDDAPVSSRWLCPATFRFAMNHPSATGGLLAGVAECGPPEGD